ncbi:hypothetical protein GCM10022256_25750 [Frondihabitans peucedani]|uniref:Uncharacterized protein n=1 Tax=Frondihabitans peucedani TaxID=598626 RepID=A0ABP8E3Z1_9MICO
MHSDAGRAGEHWRAGVPVPAVPAAPVRAAVTAPAVPVPVPVPEALPAAASASARARCSDGGPAVSAVCSLPSPGCSSSSRPR